MLMDQFLTAAEREGLLPFGAEVCRNGKVTEHWEQTPGRRYPVYSAAKSFTSTAVGLAVDEGKMALEDPLEKFFPQELDRAGGTSGDLWRQVTIRRLLTMTVPGLPFRPSGEDWLMDCFSRTFDIGRGTEFSYSNLPAYLAGVTVERAVGEHTADYLERKLFVPLEIPRPPMQLCPKGHFYGATGMELTAHELGMLGQLYLDQGVWNRKRILSEMWSREAVRRQVSNREGGYGYFFWVRPDGGFTIRGKWGQRCYVFPEAHTVVSWVSHLPEEERCRRQEELFTEAAMQEGLLPGED
ncbi:MAG TPA: beta-lactamase family protein [Candidatus Fusicatenibacter intestinigallinarum]|uniref:Beta-lactamase family protein n=1 Tax=Candidatus Fusicatenibacter intestinigallinarum TaxID=2838598 RepID=A0A9D2SP85_9FIRM|nr:beta-lactamase family protein [Candidatus Fusicatenibacter intestinigallinarum]